MVLEYQISYIKVIDDNRKSNDIDFKCYSTEKWIIENEKNKYFLVYNQEYSAWDLIDVKKEKRILDEENIRDISLLNAYLKITKSERIIFNNLKNYN